MGTVGFFHVAVGVSDMDASIAWYTNVLGMKVDLDERQKARPGGRFGDSWERRAVVLHWTDDWENDLHNPSFILDEQRPEDQFGEPKRMFEIGFHHMAMWVTDLKGILERAEGVGSEIVIPLYEANSQNIAERPGGTYFDAIVKDPDGNMFQLSERSKMPPADS